MQYDIYGTGQKDLLLCVETGSPPAMVTPEQLLNDLGTLSYLTTMSKARLESAIGAESSASMPPRENKYALVIRKALS